jgi:hypothetical protein
MENYFNGNSQQTNGAAGNGDGQAGGEDIDMIE